MEGHDIKYPQQFISTKKKTYCPGKRDTILLFLWDKYKRINMEEEIILQAMLNLVADRLISKSELAKMLQTTKRNIQRMDEISPIRIKGKNYYNLKAIIELLETNYK